MTIKSDVLLTALNSVAPAVGRNNILPILEYVHVSNECVTATSLAMSIRKKYDEKIKQEFSAVIDFNELKTICSNSKGYNITIEVDEKKIVVKCENDVYKLNGEDVSNIPVMHQEESPETFFADATFIRDLQTASLYVAGEKETKEILKSVMIFANGEVKISGSDNHKIYLSSHKVGLKTHCCIDPSFLLAIGEEPDGEISVGEKNILFVSKTLSVISRLIDAKPFDVSPYIPKQENNIVFDRNNLVRAVRKASSLKGITPFTIIDLNFTKTGAEIIYNDEVLERSIKTECQMEHKLDGETIKLNATDLITSLTSFEDNVLNMAYIDRTKPLKILSSNPNKLALLIPLVDLPKN